LGRVTTHIYDHLDDELDLASLAEIACLSPYHWHRIYQAVLGESAVDTVKRLRLQRAAAQLAQTAMPISEIAKRAHYASLPSFTRSFKASFGLPPASYREGGSHRRFDGRSVDQPGDGFGVEIITKPRLDIACVRHAGPYLEIGRAFDTLFGIAGARGLVSFSARLVGVYLDDPSCTPEAELRALAGLVIDEGARVDPPLERAELRGGPYAVLRHKGPYADMKAAYHWLFGTWLPHSGAEAGNAPVFEEYLNNPRDTPPTELRTDIHLPLVETAEAVAPTASGAHRDTKEGRATSHAKEEILGREARRRQAPSGEAGTDRHRGDAQRPDDAHTLGQNHR
jgi:AraC family transcriptional regulator